MNPFRTFWKKPESTEDKMNRIASEIKIKLSEFPVPAHRLKVMKDIVPDINPDYRVYRYHRGRKAA